MPDKHGFDHLPEWGVTYHRCIEEGCDYPGHGVVVPESSRRRHHAMHERERKRETKKMQRQNLAAGRKALAAQRRENELAYRQEGDE